MIMRYAKEGVKYLHFRWETLEETTIKNCYKNELRLTKYSRMDTNTDNKILMFEGRKP